MSERGRLCHSSLSCVGRPSDKEEQLEHSGVKAPTLGRAIHFSFAYSDFAAMRMGMSGSASFQSVRKS